MRRLACCVCLLLASAASVAQTEYETMRLPALGRLGARLEAGEFDAARDELAAYLAERPGDAVMQYNLACLLALTGDHEGALARLDVALAAGYRDLDRMLADPDLISIAGDPRLVDRVDAARADRLRRARDAGFLLDEGVWSGPLPLAPDAFVPGPGGPAASARFRYDRDALVCEVDAPGCAGGEVAGGEVVVVVARPLDLDRDESDRWFEFRADIDRGTATVTVPWSSLHPHRPPIELLLGLNAIVRQPTAGGPAARWSLVADPYAGSPSEPWRRFALASLDPGGAPAPLLAGRLDRYLVVGDRLSVELGIQGRPGGEARCTLWTAADGGGDGRDTTFTTALEPDLAYLTVDYDLADLPAGWFEVGAEISLEGCDPLAWRDRGFRLSPDWFVRERRRAADLRPEERSIVDYHLFRTLRGQQGYRPHYDPGDIAAASLAATILLDRAEATGSVLPAERCVADGAFPSGEDALQACRLVLPAVERRRGAPVVVAIAADQAEALALADALAAERAPADPRCFVTATANVVAGQPAAAADVAGALRDWLVALLAPRSVQLVGIGAAAEIARYVADHAPGGWTSIVPLASADPGATWSARILASGQ
ncbi:MAG TPA: hypothetical protein PLL30_08625 [Candidatus Krumholzibacteria bacterium]|nr:hypothetical protein [Candidatus Krumholzibacteria bacterium]HPD71823.1 hypothetical protein [Candidatus Krumholzibacteria bacterium]HRY41244.1 hypothetical protein [Candidatus Krumholzibacteria bacterium]